MQNQCYKRDIRMQNIGIYIQLFKSQGGQFWQNFPWKSTLLYNSIYNLNPIFNQYTGFE